MKTFSYATDSETGTITAASLAEAYSAMREKITGAMLADGATLWVEDVETGERETMPTPASRPSATAPRTGVTQATMINTCTTQSPGARMRELTSRTCAAPLHMEGARSLRQALSLIDEIASDAAPSDRKRYRVGVGARSIILSLMRIKARCAVRAARLSAS